MDKQKLIIIVLSIALFLAIQYFFLERWINSTQEQVAKSYQSGYDQGLKDAVISVYKQTENCHAATIGVGNFSKNVFDSSCLKKSP